MTEEEWNNLKVGDVLITQRMKLRKVVEIHKYGLVSLTWSVNIGEAFPDGAGGSSISFKDNYEYYFKIIRDTKLARKMYPNAEIEGDWLKVKML